MSYCLCLFGLPCQACMVYIHSNESRTKERRELFTLFTFVFASNSNVLISISDGWNLWYFKLKSIRIHSFKYQDLRHWVAKILGLKNHSMWQKLNFLCQTMQCSVLFSRTNCKCCLFTTRTTTTTKIFPNLF